MAKKNNNGGTRAVVAQAALPIVPTADEQLDVSTLETWLWDAACAIRGATDAPKYEVNKCYKFFFDQPVINPVVNIGTNCDLRSEGDNE